MDQESNSKPSNRGSWRDRLGINDDNAAAKPQASSEPAEAPAKPAAGGKAKVVAKPAPMAPRPGAAVKAPVRVEKAPAPDAEKVQENPKPASERPPVSSGSKDDAFAERLRQHRAAAEEAVKKRSTSPGLDKFSFAKKEVESARAESVPAKPTTPRPASPDTVATVTPPQAPAPPRPPASMRPPAQVAAASTSPATAPIRRPPPLQPVRPPAAGGGLSPSPRPSQFSPPQSPYGQPPLGQPRQTAPAYRPQGPGYAAPPGPRPQPYPGYTPQGADPHARGGYNGPRPPAPQPAPPGPGHRFAPPSSEHDLFEDNGYRPAAPLGRGSAVPSRNEPLRPDFEDPFDDKRDYGGRTAGDYSQAYREYDDEDYEEDEPRRWGGLIMVILALLTIGAIAAGLIYWYMKSGTATSGGSTGEVPVISAPEKPVKAEPDTTTKPPASAPAQGKKLIYDRILGDSSGSEPERIVPRQETPQAPASNSGDDNLLPLPLPPPPQTQGSMTPENAGPDPAQRTAGAATNSLNTQEAAGSEPAASAVLTPPAAALTESEPQTAQLGSIEQPPVPRSRPSNLVAAIQQAPSTEFRPVLQPTPAPGQQLNAPIDLQQQAAIVNQQVQAPVSNQVATPAPAPAVPQTRTVSRDDDPLSGLRAPLSSPSRATQQQVPQALQQQQSAAVTPPPLPTPQPQQPITSQSLQSFSPPPVNQNQAARATGSGYVVQLAAYRSEQEALGQYQQLRARHRNIIGDLPPAVQQTNLGASGIFYRLGMGPVASKQAATEMCNKLIAAGERDCLVRRR